MEKSRDLWRRTLEELTWRQSVVQLFPSVVCNDAFADDDVPKHDLLFCSPPRWNPTADADDKRELYGLEAGMQTRRDDCSAALSHLWHKGQRDVVTTNHAGDVRVPVRWRLSIDVPLAVPFYVKECLDGIGFQGQRAYDCYLEIFTCSWLPGVERKRWQIGRLIDCSK